MSNQRMTNSRDNLSRLIAVIVVHYGDSAALAKNCQSWKAGVPTGTRLCVVDNSAVESQPESRNSLKRFDEWHYLAHPSNPGYIGGVEAALNSLSSSGVELRGTDFIIVTNSDVENMSYPTPFLQRITKDPLVAIVGPELSPTPTWTPRDLSLIKSLVGSTLWRLRSFLPVRLVNSRVDAARSVDIRISPSPSPPDQIMVHGACFAVRLDVLWAYLALKHRPWMYGEEVLIGRILRRMGLSFVVDKNWKVNHPPKNFPRQISRRLARARACALWALAIDRSLDLIRELRSA